MKRVEGWVELELREAPDESIEQARSWMEQAQRADTSGAEYRLAYVQVETSREVID